MLTSGQASVAGTSPVTKVCIVPPGPGQIVLSNSGTNCLVGFGTNLTAANGVPIPAGGILQLDLFMGGAGGQLSAIATAGTATLGFIVSASSNQTGSTRY